MTLWSIKWSRDRWRHVILKVQGRDSNMLMAQYLENGWRYRHGSNGPPVGNNPLRFEWPRDWWRHVTLGGQGYDPNIIWARYLDNGCRYGLSANGAPIGNSCLVGVCGYRNFLPDPYPTRGYTRTRGSEYQHQARIRIVEGGSGLNPQFMCIRSFLSENRL